MSSKPSGGLFVLDVRILGMVDGKNELAQLFYVSER